MSVSSSEGDESLQMLGSAEGDESLQMSAGSSEGDEMNVSGVRAPFSVGRKYAKYDISSSLQLPGRNLRDAMEHCHHKQMAVSVRATFRFHSTRVGMVGLA